jgi:hypothetical protein
MARRLELSGRHFGELLVQQFAYMKKGFSIWKCLCSCGKITFSSGSELNQGKINSCGHLRIRIEDLLGQRFARLVIVESIKERNASNKVIWKAKCDCGNEVIIAAGSLKSGATKSCGCFRQDTTSAFSKKTKRTHGFTVSSDKLQKNFYKVWSAMLDRCYNPKHPKYKDYGGRGITVCERWHKFENFRDDMWEPYLEHGKIHGFGFNTSLDRFPSVMGNYEPSNCRWATQSEQCRNRRDSSKTENYDLARKCRVQLMHFVNRILFEKRENFYSSTNKKCLEIVGCTPEQLREHIDKQFLPGMTWDNHGIYTLANPHIWQIDHIILCNMFDLSTEQGRKACFNYKNLRPWWGKDNNFRKVDSTVFVVNAVVNTP